MIVQPANRKTGPGLLLPLLWIAHRDPKAMVAVFPAYHFIWEESWFLAHVAEAVGVSSRCLDRIILLGMEPEVPETGYGWTYAESRGPTGGSRSILSKRYGSSTVTRNGFPLARPHSAWNIDGRPF